MPENEKTKESDKIAQDAEKVRKFADDLGYQIVAYLVYDQGGVIPNATLIPKNGNEHTPNAGSGGTTDGGGKPDTQEIPKPVRVPEQPANSDTKSGS